MSYITSSRSRRRRRSIGSSDNVGPTVSVPAQVLDAQLRLTPVGGVIVVVDELVLRSAEKSKKIKFEKIINRSIKY